MVSALFITSIMCVYIVVAGNWLNLISSIATLQQFILQVSTIIEDRWELVSFIFVSFSLFRDRVNLIKLVKKQ